MMSFSINIRMRRGGDCGMLRNFAALSSLLLLATPLCLAQPLFPSGSTVVLLSGLAGDSESESLYREQLQSWIDLTSAQAGILQVLAFSEAPDSIHLPAGAKCKLATNDRKSFLASVASLPQATTNLVVIAWGHGGRQGQNPVLHVRGPRIIPADFSALAARAQASQWVLMFRGSGAFARQLVTNSVQVISSDVDQSFTSDPVGLPLMLKLARGPAAESFSTLAAEFGRATARWYQERTLARTEDPALWTSDAEPRLLAAAGTKAPPEKRESVQQANSQPRPELETKTNSTSKPQEPANTELSGAWAGIKKVDPAAYPDEDAVVLSHSLDCRLGTDPALVTEQDSFIQVLTAEGKSVGDFDISYNPPEEEIEFHDCEVLRPDGRVVHLDTDNIGEARDQPLGDYRAERRRFFSLPGVVPGAVLHVRYTTRWRKFPLPQISMSLPVGKDMTAVRSSMRVSVPRDVPFHWALENISAPDPVVKSGSYATTYTWQFQNLAGHRREILSAPRSEARLSFSTFQDWAAFADWYDRISRLTGEVTPDIAAKAKELTANAGTDREKLLALYNYVTALRYVAVPLGINSVRPHAAENVLKNQFGDCKDKANLLNSMLRALDVEAHLVLVPRFSQAREALPGMAFNHAISRVKLGPEILWVDTTDDVCRFGMLPPGDHGRKVLVVGAEPKSLSDLPAAEPSKHRLEIEGVVTCGVDSVACPQTLRATGFGYPDYELRAAYRDSRENRVALPLLASKFRPIAGSFAMETQQATAVSALDQDFTWAAEGNCVGLVGQKAEAWTVHSPFWLPKEWDYALHRRKTPLFLNQGYPLILTEKFEIRLPAKLAEVALPPSCENSDGPLRWRIGWARLGDDTLEAKLNAELQAGELSADQTAAFQHQLRSLLVALGDDARVRAGANRSLNTKD